MASGHWKAVVKVLDLERGSDGQAYGPCPVHGGDRKSAFSVGEGDNGWPVMTCWTGCPESRLPPSDPRRRQWFDKACKRITKRHPELREHLRPPKGRAVHSAPRKADRKRQRAGKPLPTDEQLGKWHQRLMEGDDLKDARNYLRHDRGLKKRTLRRFGIGSHYSRFQIPVRDATGEVVNVRRYDPTKDKEKFQNIAGHGDAVLYPVEALEQAGPEAPVFLVEGELDALLAGQHGLLALSGTGGASTPPKDLEALAGRTVFVVYDADTAGRAGARKVANLLHDKATVHIVRLDDGGIPFSEDRGQDVTDWFVTHGRTADELRDLAEQAPAYDPDDLDDDDLGLITLADLDEERLEWLWRGRLPLGKLSVLEGDPDLGKSVTYCDLAARVSTGRCLPACDEHGDPEAQNHRPRDVLFIAAEDGLRDTVKPRLRAAGADQSRIHTLGLKRDESANLIPLTIPEDLCRVMAAAKRVRAALIVLDPITAYLSESINSHSDASTRRALTPLAEVAEKTGASILMIRHLNKSGEAKALYRGGGSIAFTGAARSGLIVDRHPDDPEVRVVAQTKNNLAKDKPSIVYRVEGWAADDSVPAVVWGDEIQMTADQLLAKKDGRNEAPQRDEAVAFLRDVLGDGPLPVSQIQAEAKAAGIAWRTVERAKGKAGAESVRVRSRKSGKTKGWSWSIGPKVDLKKGRKG